MRKTHNHTTKSKIEREYYAKALKDLDYEPTVDETIKFPETDDRKRDFSLPKSPHRRKISFKQKVSDHFEENWIKWLLTGACVVIFFLMIDSKTHIASINTKVDTIKEDVTELKKTEKENLERFHKHELELQEVKFKMEVLEKKDEK